MTLTHDLAKFVAQSAYQVMFEAADPGASTWYIKTYGPEVNLFVDHSQIVQLEGLRLGNEESVGQGSDT